MFNPIESAITFIASGITQEIRSKTQKSDHPLFVWSDPKKLAFLELVITSENLVHSFHRIAGGRAAPPLYTGTLSANWYVSGKTAAHKLICKRYKCSPPLVSTVHVFFLRNFEISTTIYFEIFLIQEWEYGHRLALYYIRTSQLRLHTLSGLVADDSLEDCTISLTFSAGRVPSSFSQRSKKKISY